MILTGQNQELLSVGYENESFEAYIDEKFISFIFNTLSSFYSDKHGSIVRELCNNAFDTMVEAGIEKPIVEIRYKDEDSSIHFTDKGKGMTPEFMRKVFMSYGNSTRRDSNVYNGAFGLGSKSPFSLTSVYYIDSTVDGVEYKYMISRNEKGKPAFDILLASPTDAPNGTTVWFHIDKNDYNLFKEAIKLQLKYYDNVFVDGFPFNDNYKIYRGKYFVYRPDLGYASSLLEICNGKNVYPINFNLLDIPEIRCNVGLRFDIGELELVENRESIKYSAETIQKIKERIELLKAELIEMYERQPEEVNTLRSYLMRLPEKPMVDFDGIKYNMLDISFTKVKKAIYIKSLKDTNLNLPNLIIDEYVNFAFFSRKNQKSKSYYSDRLLNSRSWYSLTDDNVDKKLKKLQNEWKYLLTRKKYINYPHLINILYKNKNIIANFDDEGLFKDIHNPENIDYKYEIDLLLALIERDVIDDLNGRCIDDINIERKTPIKVDKNSDEVIVSLESVSIRSVMTLDRIKSLAQNVYYTNDKDTFYMFLKLFQSQIHLNEKKFNGEYISVFSFVYCSKKYNEKIELVAKPISEISKNNYIVRMFHRYISLSNFSNLKINYGYNSPLFPTTFKQIDSTLNKRTFIFHDNIVQYLLDCGIKSPESKMDVYFKNLFNRLRKVKFHDLENYDLLYTYSEIIKLKREFQNRLKYFKNVK